MRSHWALMIAAAVIGTGAPQSTNPLGNESSGYRFRYFVRDDRTGDVKGQTEIRQGDDVRGSYAVADPNGSTRVVTYTAGKGKGFNARVQVHSGTPALPNGESQLPLSHLMKIPPRNIFRTGFQPFEIKVIPPSSTETPQVTQKPPFTPEEEALLQRPEEPKPGYSEQHLEVFHPSTDLNKVEYGSSTVHDYDTSTESSLGVLSSTTPKEEQDPCPTICDNTDEKGSRLKQEGDKVQVEMGQVIRTEMKEPEDVNMGTPYQNHYQSHMPRPVPQPPNSQFRPDVMSPVYMRPVFLRPQGGPITSQWPSLVSSGNRLYIPHIVVEKDNAPPEVFPSKVYLVPLPRPLALTREDLMSLGYPWDGTKTTILKEEHKPNRPTFTYPPTVTYLLLPKDPRG